MWFVDENGKLVCAMMCNNARANLDRRRCECLWWENSRARGATHRTWWCVPGWYAGLGGGGTGRRRPGWVCGGILQNGIGLCVCGVDATCSWLTYIYMTHTCCYMRSSLELLQWSIPEILLVSVTSQPHTSLQSSLRQICANEAANRLPPMLTLHFEASCDIVFNIYSYGWWACNSDSTAAMHT